MRLADKPKNRVQWSPVVENHGCQVGRLGLDDLWMYASKSLSQWSLGKVIVVPIKARPPFCCHKEMAIQVAVAWCHSVSQLDLSLTGWPWTCSFTSLSPKPPLQRKERWTWGSAGTLLVPYQLSHQSSDDALLFLPIHIGPGVFKCSLTTQPFSLPPNPSDNSVFLYPRKPHFANGTQSSKMQPKQSKWAASPSPPSGAWRSRPVFN